MDKEINQRLDNLTRTLDRLVNSMSRSVNVGKSVPRETEGRSADKKNKKLEDTVTDTISVLSMVKDAFYGTSKVSQLLTGNMRDMIAGMDDRLKKYKGVQDDLIKSSLEYYKSQGLANKSIYEANANLSKLSIFTEHLTKAYDTKLSAELELNKLQEQLIETTGKRARFSEFSDEGRALDKEIKKLSNKVNEAGVIVQKNDNLLIKSRNNLASEISQLAALVGENHPVFDGFTQDYKEFIKDGVIPSTMSMEVFADQTGVLSEKIKINSDVVATAASAIEESVNNLQDSISAAVKNIARMAGAGSVVAVNKIVDAALAQMRYNISESNFVEAALAGVSDEFLSETLATFKTEIGILTGQFDVSEGAGQFTQMARKMALDMGLTGEEGLKAAANLTKLNFTMGLGAKNVPAFYKSIEYMAEGARITADEAIEYMNELSESGVLQTMRMDIIDPEERQKAIMADTERLLMHGKALGKSVKSIAEFQKSLNVQKYGNVEDLIRQQIGRGLAADMAGMSAEQKRKIDEATLRQQMGTETGEDRALLQAFTTQLRQNNKDMMRSGDILGAAINRQIVNTVSGGDVVTDLSAQGLVESDVEAARVLSGTGDQAITLEQLRTGIIDEQNNSLILNNTQLDTMKKRIDDVNSSLVPMVEEYLPAMKNLLSGMAQNPVGAAIGGAGGIMGILGSGADVLMNYLILKKLGVGTGILGKAKSLLGGGLNMAKGASAGLGRLGGALATRVGLGTAGAGAASTIGAGALPVTAAGLVGTAVGTGIFELSKGTRELATVTDGFFGSIQALTGVSQSMVNGLFGSEIFDEAEDNIRMGNQQIENAMVGGALAIVEKLTYIPNALGLITDDALMDVKKSVISLIQDTDAEITKSKRDNQEEDPHLAALEAIQQNTKKAVDLQVDEKTAEIQNLFKTRSLDDIQTSITKLQTAADQKMNSVNTFMAG